MLVTVLDLKHETGLTAPAIRNALQLAGVPAHPPLPGERGNRFDHDAALAAIKGNVSFGHVTDHAVAGRGSVTDTSFNSLAGVRARVETARAIKLETEAGLRSGKLVEREAVTAALVEIVVKVRTALLGIGSRAAPLVIGKSDLLEIANVINGAAREVLGELADDQSLNDAVLG